MNSIRPAAVAGTFYPGNPEKLTQDIQAMLHCARRADLPQPPKAIVVPHAGYIYSGPVAACAYATLEPLQNHISRVVLLGPVHRVPVRGLALPGNTEFATPLGNLPIDREGAMALRSLPQVVESTAAHAWEHSLEVQLPFLQSVLGQFSLLPLAVGDATANEVAEALDLVWGGPETLIVISSDLSHYLPYETAKRVDENTAHSVLDLHQLQSHEQACGATPVNGLIIAAKRHHLKPCLLDLRNSGDTAGDKDRVVGYAAFAFLERSEHVH